MNRGGFMLEYERFGRAHGESQFRFSGRPPTVEQGTFSLWLSADYMADAELLRITPDPASQEVASDGVRYRFRRRDGTSPQIIIFRFKPERPGSLSGSFRLNDGPPSSFRQWLAP